MAPVGLADVDPVAVAVGVPVAEGLLVVGLGEPVAVVLPVGLGDPESVGEALGDPESDAVGDGLGVGDSGDGPGSSVMAEENTSVGNCCGAGASAGAASKPHAVAPAKPAMAITASQPHNRPADVVAGPSGGASSGAPADDMPPG